MSNDHSDDDVIVISEDEARYETRDENAAVHPADRVGDDVAGDDLAGIGDCFVRRSRILHNACCIADEFLTAFFRSQVSPGNAAGTNL